MAMYFKHLGTASLSINQYTNTHIPSEAHKSHPKKHGLLQEELNACNFHKLTEIYNYILTVEISIRFNQTKEMKRIR